MISRYSSIIFFIRNPGLHPDCSQWTLSGGNAKKSAFRTDKKFALQMTASGHGKRLQLPFKLGIGHPYLLGVSPVSFNQSVSLCGQVLMLASVERLPILNPWPAFV